MQLSESFQTIAILAIFGISLAGGLPPLLKREKSTSAQGFPLGQAFTAGVFLALALVLMLPAAFHLWGKVLPGLDFPLASFLALCAFTALLWFEQIFLKAEQDSAGAEPAANLSPPAFPVVMTILIAIPSFLLGTALGGERHGPGGDDLLRHHGPQGHRRLCPGPENGPQQPGHGQILALVFGLRLLHPIGHFGRRRHKGLPSGLPGARHKSRHPVVRRRNLSLHVHPS